MEAEPSRDGSARDAGLAALAYWAEGVPVGSERYDGATPTGPETGDGAVTNFVQSTNTFLRGLQSSSVWAESGGVSLTYGFATTAAHLTHIQTNSTENFPAINGASGAYNPLDGTTGIDAALTADVAEALGAISSVANITFTLGAFDGADTDLKFASFDNLADTNGGLNGRATFPGADDHPTAGEGFESYVFLNSMTASMTTNPELGGSSNRLHTTIHEIGHALGLTHPQDTFQGDNWTSANLTGAGENALDNARYTLMSAERGGLDVNTQNLAFGSTTTPMALDVATLHHIYGSRANHSGATTYTLLDQGTAARDLEGDDGSVAIGRAFYAIWDTGGVDSITYSGGARALLNLNEATFDQNGDPAHVTQWLADIMGTALYAGLSQELKDDLSNNDFHAGGFFSRIFSDAGVAALGGYAIASAQFASAGHAAGAIIENASGGNQSDLIIGNEQANLLTANGGDDVVHSSWGNDTIFAGAGADLAFGGAESDSIDGGIGNDTLSGGDGFDTLLGGDGNDTLLGGFGSDTLDGGTGADALGEATPTTSTTWITPATSFSSSPGKDLTRYSPTSTSGCRMMWNPSTSMARAR